MTYYDNIRNALAGPLAPLARYGQFMLWKLIPDVDGGKPRKMPLTKDGAPGSSTNPACWTDANTAIAAAERLGHYVAFVMSSADPFTFIDIDGCIVNGAWTPFAHNVLTRFPGAAFEVSQSGTGAHLFLRGNIPEGFTGRKSDAIEIYASQRFVALTGNAAQGNADIDFGDVLRSTIAEHFGVNHSRANEVRSLSDWTYVPVPEWSGPEDDAELLRQFLAEPVKLYNDAARAFAHLTGDTTPTKVPVSNADLYYANSEVLSQAWPDTVKGGFDKSDAAYALACRLAYWTGKNCERVSRIMAGASFKRTKADASHGGGTTYWQWDILGACAATTSVRYQRADVANAAVVADGNAAYDGYYERVSSAGDVHAIRAIASELSTDSRIDPTYREMLTGHILQAFKQRGEHSTIKLCRDLTRLRSAHPAPDRQELQKQINRALQVPDNIVSLAPIMTVEQLLGEFVMIGQGSAIASISNRNRIFNKIGDFSNYFAASKTVAADNKSFANTELWREHPSRRTVDTLTFRAGAPVITQDPDGNSSVNTWRPTVRDPNASADLSPFFEQIEYMFGADSGAFLDWFAHLEQRPDQLPHFGWLHISDHHGTGRNWLSSVIARLHRGYVAPSVDMDRLIGGNYNGVLSGRTIAIVDEIRTGAREDAYMLEGKIRSMLTEETRYLRPKFAVERNEFNSCRWLLFSNHKNAIPMSAADRRWYVVHSSKAPRSAAVYAHIYSIMDQPGFIDALGNWLRARDLSAFNHGGRPPVTDAKSKAIAASRSDFQRMAENVVNYWPADFISTADLHSVMNEGETFSAGRKLSPAMKHALQDAGMHYLEQQLRDGDGVKQRVWIVRNVGEWLANLSPMRVTLEFHKLKLADGGVTGFDKLMSRM
jgi:primase-polymerase (primpol)-like protein